MKLIQTQLNLVTIIVGAIAACVIAVGTIGLAPLAAATPKDTKSEARCPQSLNPNASKMLKKPATPATYRDKDGTLRISKKADRFAGEEVNTKKFRAPIVVDRIGQPGEKDAYMVIDNFLHEGQYFRAKIPVGSNHIKKTYIQTMPFPVAGVVMAGHVQARFEFHPEHKIQLLDAKGNQVGTVDDNIVSYEAALTHDGSYNFIIGAMNANPLVGRQVSASQKVAEATGEDGDIREFINFDISMTPEELGYEPGFEFDPDDPTRPLDSVEMAQLLSGYLEDSANKGMQHFYNTVVANCTTTIFDGIDRLPRFQKLRKANLLQEFLTMLGGDPVIGPAQNALIDRFGRNFHRTHNMEEGKPYKSDGDLRTHGVPERVENERKAFAPGGEHPMTMLFTTEGKENLTKSEKEVVDQLVDELIGDLPQIFNLLISVADAMSGNILDSPDLIASITKAIESHISDRLASLESKLPKEKVTINLRFTPYPTENTETDLRPYGYRARLPFGIERVDLDVSNREEVLELIEEGIKQIDEKASDEVPAFVKNFTLKIDVQENASHLQSQILVGLGQYSHALEEENEKVSLTSLDVPSQYEFKASYFVRFKNFIRKVFSKNPKPERTFVNALLTHRHDFAHFESTANIRFGVSPELTQSGLIAIPEVARNKLFCWSGAHPHTPQLVGSFTDNAYGNETWLKRAVSRALENGNAIISVTGLDMDMEELNIRSARVRVGKIFNFFRCLELPDVNEQVEDNANRLIGNRKENTAAPSAVGPN